MASPPMATRTLSHIFVFDTSEVANAEALPSKDHQAAMTQACQLTRIHDAGGFFCKATLTTGPIDVASVQALPCDAWHTTGDARVEFIYSSSAPKQIGVRLATELEKLDGNRAVRLMLHTLELLEGASPEQVRASCAAFDAVIANRPPYVQTMRNLFQFASMLARGAALHALHGVVLPRLRRLLGVPTAAADAARPVTPRGFYSYYSAPNPAPANFQCFVSPGRNTFRPFMDFFESWRVASGRVGVVYIINLPVNPGPGPVVEGFVPTAHDALDIVKRYRGVRSPSGAPPPPGEAWVFKNPTMVQELFMNNYGSHKHSFRSKPTAHKWDWIGIAAPIAGAGAITINGTSLFWLRGTRGELDEQAKRLAPLLGAPVASVDQICNWPRSKGA